MDNDTSAYLADIADRYQPGDDEFKQHILATADAESGGRPDAVSPKGALGRMQIMPATARGFGVDPDTATPEELDDAAVRFKSHLWNKYGRDPTLTAAAYHAGEGAVDRAGGIPNTNDGLSSTADYVAKVTGKSRTPATTALPDLADQVNADYDKKTAQASPTKDLADQVNDEYDQANPVAPPPAPAQNDFVRGLKSFVPQMESMGFGALGFAAHAFDKIVGSSPTAQRVTNWAMQHYADAQKNEQAGGQQTDDLEFAYKDARDNGNFGSLAKWLEFNLGNATSFLGAQGAAMLAGGLVGSAVGPEGTLGGAVAGVAEQGALKAAINRFAAGYVAKNAERIAASGAAEGATADAIQAEAVKQTAAQFVNAGRTAGAAAFNVPTMVGATYGSAVDEAKKNGEELTGPDLLRIGAAGTVAGIIGTVANKAGLHGLQEGGLEALAGKSLSTRLAGGAAIYGAGGAGEMVGMTAAQRYGAGQPLTGDDADSAYINAAGLGGVMGAGPGAIAGAKSRFRTPAPLGDGTRTVDPVQTIMDPDKDIDQAIQSSLEMTRATSDSLLSPDERLAIAKASQPAAPVTDDPGLRLARAADLVGPVDPQELSPGAKDTITSSYLKNIDERGGVALQHEADHLAEVGAGQPYDSVLPAEPLKAPEGARPDGAAPADLVEQLQSVNTPAAGKLLADLRAGRISPAEARPAADQMTQEGVQKDAAFTKREQAPELNANERLAAAAAEAPRPDTTVADRLTTAAKEAPAVPAPEPARPGSPIVKASTFRPGDVVRLPSEEGQPERKMTMLDTASLPKASPSAPTNTLNQTTASLLNDLGRKFGKKVQFYGSDGPDAPGGFVHSGHADTIFINRDAKEAHLAIFGHELFHLLKRESPDAARAFQDAVTAQMTPEAAEKFKANYGAIAGDTAHAPGGLGAEHIEELSADLMGNSMTKPEFWAKIFDKVGEPKAASRLSAIVQRAVRSVLGAFSGKGFAAEHYVSDFKAIHDAAARALSQYAQDRAIPAREMEIHRLKAAQETSRMPIAKRTPSESTVQKEGGAVKQSPPRGHFEVAPDPRDVKSKEAWDAMDYHDRQRVSLNVVEQLVPKVLNLMGVKGKLEPQVGGWRADNNPAFMLQIDDESKLPRVAAELAKILKQEAVGMVADHPFPGSTPHTEFKIILPKNMGYGEIARVYEQLRGIKEGGESIIQGHSTTIDGNDMRVLHDPKKSGITSADLHQRIRSHMGSEYGVEAAPVHAAFIEKPEQGHESGNGKSQSGATDLLRDEASRLAAAEIERARQGSRKGAEPEAGKRAGGTDDVKTSAVRDAVGAKDENETPRPVPRRPVADAQAPERAKQDGRGSAKGDTFVGTHYSHQPRTSISGDYYGTGIRGAERHRLAGAEDPRIRSRSDFYINKGKGVTPEMGLGRYAHEATLDGMYNGSDNPENIPSKDMNKFESEVLNRGYKGYYVRNNDAAMGRAVVLGEHARDIPATHVGEGPRPARNDLPEVKQSTSRKENFDRYMQGAAHTGVMYHGTARDIDTFRAKQAGATFLTHDPRFAEDFAHMSLEWMKTHAAEELGEAKAQEIFEQARKNVEAKQDFYNDGLEPDFEQKKLEIRQEYSDLLAQSMPTGQNIMPLHTRVQYPFDYENRFHVKALADRVFAHTNELHIKGSSWNKAEFIDSASKGNWVVIEDPKVQKAIKELGHDGFHVRESMRKNLGVYNPADIKSAIGNNGDFDRNKPSIIESRKRAETDEGRAQIAQIVKHLTPAEQQRFTERSHQALIDSFNAIPTDETAAIAFAGRAKRGWYANTVRALGNVFGPDAPRFAALLAALSPMRGVKDNLDTAVRIFTAWHKAGRPTDRDAILRIADGQARQAGAGKLMLSYRENTVTALAHDDPVGAMLSGPKVDSFMKNLAGHTGEVTLDGWMAMYGKVNEKIFAGSKLAGDLKIGKNAGYLGYAAKVRAVADRLTELTGETWTPAEVQETVWSWAKTLYETAGALHMTAKDAVRNEILDHDLIASTPDFATLFHTDVNDKLLRDAGYGAKLDALKSERVEGGADREVGGPGSEAAPFAPEAQRQHELAAAGRLDEAKYGSAAARLDAKTGPVEKADALRRAEEAVERTKVYESSSRAYNFGKDLTPDQDDALRRVGVIKDKETVKQQIAKATANWKLKAVQGILDQYRAVKDVSPVAYRMMRMANSSEGSLEAQLLFGKLKLDQGEYVPSVDTKDPTGGFAAVMGSLQGEHPRFLAWVAAQRAESLKAQGRENLFTDADISQLKTLDQGQLPDGTDRGPAYAEALKNLTEYNKAVLDIGLKRGMISQELYDNMRDQPYVPFYRAMVDKDGGPVPASGMTGQYFAKKLKGGEEQLKDNLLGNVIQNWSHILTASAKNEAAVRAIDDMQAANLAHMAVGDEPGVRITRNGQEERYVIHDPYVAEAMAALNYVAPAYLKPFGAMKRILTYGITANPVFKLRTLLRETAAATAQSEISKNFASNLVQGWKNTRAGSDIFAQTLASGGQIRFGSMERGPRLDKLIQRAGGTVIDETHIEKWGRMISDAAEFYHEVGNRVENVNRTALYEQLRAKGYSHSDASFAAKDLLDFTASGRWPVVKFLTSSVPFMNARLQSAYAMVRAGTLHPAQVGAVVGAVALGSLGLMLYEQQNNKEWWDSRTDYDRDAYWAVKFGDHAMYIPKPFELGAMGTMAERLWELGVDHSITASQFGHNFGQTILNTFAMDPTPQIVKPLAAVWANKDPGTQRPIESTAEQQLRPEDRYDENTSYVARALGSIGLPNPASLVEAHWDALSPVQLDYLLKGYFGSLATLTTAGIDAMIHPLTGEGASPAWKSDTYSLGFYKEAPSDQSAFTEALYNRATQVHEAFASLRRAREMGDTEKVREIMTEEKDNLRQKPMIDAAEKQISAVNKMILQVKASTSMDADAKRAMLTRLNSQKNSIAERVHAGTVSMSG